MASDLDLALGISEVWTNIYYLGSIVYNHDPFECVPFFPILVYDSVLNCVVYMQTLGLSKNMLILKVLCLSDPLARSGEVHGWHALPRWLGQSCRSQTSWSNVNKLKVQYLVSHCSLDVIMIFISILGHQDYEYILTSSLTLCRLGSKFAGGGNSLHWMIMLDYQW